MIAASIAEAEKLLRDGAIEDAMAVLAQARTLDGSAVERYELGEALLRASNGCLGWELYDLHPSRTQDRLRRVKRWEGEHCGLLVVVAEQGFGDAIQFLRFVPTIVGRADRVVLAVHDELLALVRSSPLLSGVETIGKSQARRMSWPPTTQWERLMSLPAKLSDLHVEPAGAYLRTPRARAAYRPFPRTGRGLKVGVAWRSTARRGFPGRSIPARLVRQLTEINQVRVVALHRRRDIRATSHGAEVVDIHDFADTATVIAQCDIVVTADTVTAHLAPALGVATLVCLRHWPDWRWGTPANPTAWYTHARLLFQDPSQRWEPVISNAAKRIADSMTAVKGDS